MNDLENVHRAKEWRWTLPLHNTGRLTQIDQNLNLRAKTIKLLRESTGEILCDVEFGNDFLDMMAKAQIEEKNR